METQDHSNTSVGRNKLIVLVTTLFAIPLIWGMGLFSIPMAELFPDLARPRFWSFVATILFLEWLAFGLIYWALKPNVNAYLSISSSFLNKYKYYLGGGFLVLLALAGVAPNYLYPDGIPSTSDTLGFLGPVTSIERMAFIFLSLTAGICEEVIFRGYGITTLERLTKNKPLPLIISSAAFMSLHGIAFIPIELMIQYFVIGLIFGFLFQRYRRLEWLVIVHFLIDALIAVSVP